jgi:hypothetical protein
MNKKEPENNKKEEELPGYKPYPDKEDIYNKFKEEELIAPEDLPVKEDPVDKLGKNNEKDFKDVKTGDDLDVPGSELDDPQEEIGDEDEENNYYSLGGDDHEDLEEDKGD